MDFKSRYPLGALVEHTGMVRPSTGQNTFGHIVSVNFYKDGTASNSVVCSYDIQQVNEDKICRGLNEQQIIKVYEVK